MVMRWSIKKVVDGIMKIYPVIIYFVVWLLSQPSSILDIDYIKQRASNWQNVHYHIH